MEGQTKKKHRSKSVRKKSSTVTKELSGDREFRSVHSPLAAGSSEQRRKKTSKKSKSRIKASGSLDPAKQKKKPKKANKLNDIEQHHTASSTHKKQHKKKSSQSSDYKERKSRKVKRQAISLKQAKRNRILYRNLSIVSAILILIDVCMILFFVQYSKAEVISASMETTLMTNDRVLVDNDRKPVRFNLSVFYPPRNDRQKYVKRVIGLPGDEVEYHNDVLYINGKATDEPYLEANKRAFYAQSKDKTINYTEDFSIKDIIGSDKIPEGYYLMLGDNRRNSQDSRFIGLIPETRLVGIVVIRYFPFREVGPIVFLPKLTDPVNHLLLTEE